MVSGIDPTAARGSLARQSAAAAIALIEDEASALEYRRLLRQPKGRAGITYQCGACKRFLRGPGVTCGSCGYDQGKGWW